MTKFIFFFILLINACTSHKSYLTNNNLENTLSLVVINDKKNVVYIPQEKNLSSFLKITQTKTIQMLNEQTIYHFKEDLLIQPTMNNVILELELVANNKNKQNFVSENYTDPQSKENFLRIIVPYLKKGDQLIIKSSYNWMDVRDLPSLNCNNSLNYNCTIEVEVPYEVQLNYAAALSKKEILWQPSILETSQKVWSVLNDKKGQKFIFDNKKINNNEKSVLELVLAFKEALYEQKESYLDDWFSVSKFIYNKMPQNIIVHESIKSIVDKTILKKDTWEDFIKIINFAKTIEIAPFYKEQKYQKIKPSYITLREKKGSELDIVILLQSMLNYVNIYSYVAIAKNTQNDMENRFYSPAIFTHPILIIFVNNNFYYFDPHNKQDSDLNLSKYIFGQKALIIQEKNTGLIQLPYEN